jgi:histone acetyltransferase (RNA polymerase elongator complex component)
MSLSKNYYIIPIFVPHSGCPHDCVFCNQKRITGSLKNIEAQDVENTINKYLETINRVNSHVEVSFFGGSFTGIPIEYQNELLRVAKEALDLGKVDSIRLSTRPDYISERILDNLRNYSVGVIELGVQSMDEEVLKLSERGHTAMDVIKASKLIKEYGFTLGLQMMIGLPGDNEKKDHETASKIIALEPDFVRIYPALVIRETLMEQMYYKGTYIPLTVDSAVEISKEIYKLFIKHKIPVIRIGLQPTTEINVGGDVIAGPFHPAFRELVESSLLNEMLVYMVNINFINSKSIDVYVNPKDISKLFADKKNIFYNKIKDFTSIKIIIRQNNACERGSLQVLDSEKSVNMSINEYVNIMHLSRNFQ